jgi:hypothetical protein
MEWQPIETAPRDRSIIIVAHEFWRRVGLVQYVYPEGFCHYVDGTKVDHQHLLTHWMPLPEPPQ